ncbi:hypothetical protein OIU76_006382 [Salix suchowensis]|nr:hypothetical protein OIU76_006382 [Salix suchowensis]
MDSNPQSSGGQFRPMVPTQQGTAVHSGGFSTVSATWTRPMTSSQPQQSAPPLSNHMHVYGTSGVPNSSPYAFAPSSFGMTQNNASALPQFPPMSQMHAPIPAVAQPSISSSSDLTVAVSSNNQQSLNDWQEHTASDGRRYYYNRRTKQSSWDKPLELMTPIERADASTVWKEFTTQEGKKYYYNKVTKQSKWSIPEELKIAREQAQQTVGQGTQSETDAASKVPTAVVVTSSEISTTAISGFLQAQLSVTPVTTIANPPPVVVSGSPALPDAHSTTASAVGVQSSVTPLPTAVSVGTGASAAAVDAKTTPLSSIDNLLSQGAANSVDGASMMDTTEFNKVSMDLGKTNASPLEEKSPDEEPLVFTNKLEAKNAFKALLESANVQSDWTWEQTMREIINDKRYGALKTLGERKQAFNEYLGQRKKLEAEERRIRQKKAREEFAKMLEESKELTSSMKWSKATSLFENDERYKALERPRDREDLFDSYIVELERKEKEKAAEDRRRNVAEYRKFLESCDFIKASSQWRKIQDRLEDDERCLCLEKLDRLLIFQDYIRDLEKEEEEQKKIHKEQLRRAERKNRDEFRKMLEEHVASGSLTAKTHWLDYCLKVKDLPPYQAIAMKYYHDDKTRIKDAMKLGKITMVSTWTFEDFKGAVSDDIGSPPISDINLKLLYEELVERAKEKEEKEAKKQQRLADDFTNLLYTIKEVTASSNWEDCKLLFEESQEYRSIGEESLSKEIFEEYVTHLQEKAKEKERKREEEKAKKEKEREEKDKRKEKERKEKEKEREREKGKQRTKKNETDGETVDASDGYGHKDDKKREKDKDRKHRKRHQSATDDVNSDKDEKEESKKSRRHSSDRKKSRKHTYTPESDGESQHKRHKRDHRDGSRRNGSNDELEDGELGDDVEIRKQHMAADFDI